ncbi:MAG: PQQ-binding-like beta-propeller repeat protein, partial [Planctomycetaceae bacterium]
MIQYVICVAALLASVTVARAGDWPMWRHDAGRTATTTHALPKALRLHWMRELPRACPAWPVSQTRLQFDTSYLPVVMGERMFVGSTVDDTIRAYGTKDGRELWRFYTNGPVRLAPVAVDGRVYAASDDGHLYCLSAATGKLEWKVNGGPSIRPIIGNDRLVSSWPARGGPVCADGVVYFAAGIWPSMGVFIHAVDAKTGRKLWTNSETGSRYVVHPHGAPSFGSVVPQGHLVVNGDALIVPGGRSTPAVLDRRTGKLRFFQFDNRAGHHRVVSAGPYYFVSGNRYGVNEGASAGRAAPDVLTGDLAIFGKSRTITAEDIRGKTRRRLKKDRRGHVRISLEFTTKTRWTITPTNRSPVKAFLTAGSQIYTGEGKTIARFAMPKTRPGDKPVTVKQAADWTATVDGDVWTMLAADDRLFVVTRQGRVYCFGAGKREPVRHTSPKRELPNADPAVAELVSKIVHSTGLQRRTAQTQSDPAFCVVLGGANDGFVAELTRAANVNAIVIDGDPVSVARLRKTMSAAGISAARVSAHLADAIIPLPPYLAECIVVLDPKSAGIDFSAASLRRLFRPLRPYGGTACLRLSAEQHKTFVLAVTSAELANARVSRSGGLTLLTRVGALPRSAGWTHQYGNAANSVVSLDDLVKAPLGVLWFGGPSHDKVLPRHGHGPNPQVAGGRLVIEGPDMLRAVDVYTGRLLWETELKGVGKYYDTTRHFAGAGEIGTNYVTLPDAVYVVYGSRLIELDAATGKPRRSYSLTAKRGRTPPQWGFASVDGNYLVATSSPVRVAGSGGAGKVADIPRGHRAVIPSGAQWKYLAGKDAPPGWSQPGFNDAKWKTGSAGFGYGDGDDSTVLKRMRGRYSRVYVRRTFDAKDVKNASRLALLVNYDDAFIAYLNGREIVRAGVGRGNGASAKRIQSHEATAFEFFSISEFRKLLRPGENVLALEGHNSGPTSSDFTLDPLLIAKGPAHVTKTPTKPIPKTPAFETVRYSSASKRLVVYDRKSGRLLWQRKAAFNFRHNCIAVASGKLFCIDGLSPAKLKLLKRRVIDASGNARLYALDL